MFLLIGRCIYALCVLRTSDWMGSYSIRVSKTDSKEVVDLSDHGNVQSGTAVQLWSDAGTDNQTWTFEESMYSEAQLDPRTL